MMAYVNLPRRKIGVLTLVMACLFAAGWIRSLYLLDTVFSHSDGNQYSIGSVRGLVFLGQTVHYEGQPNFLFRWFSADYTNIPSATNIWTGYNSVQRIGFAGLEIGVGNLDSTPRTKSYVATIPYWFLVLPLTLLSAWLLLGKPRARKPTDPKPGTLC